MKDKKKSRQKVISRVYRRNRTLSNSCLSISQLVQLGSYKKRINDLSRNNRHLATALQEARLENAVQQNMLKDYAKDVNNILFARVKLNEMTKSVEKFVTDLEEVRSYLNFELQSDKNPFTHKRGDRSPTGRIIKQPAINCIEEVSYESSVNEVVVPENAPASSDLIPIRGSDDKMSDILPSNPENNVVENMEVAPILFTDDSEGKKKSSAKGKISKKASDPENVSLTPELNIDLTSVKLKRNSSRRRTQFSFPGSRSTSKGKTLAETENTSEELMAPGKPASPSLNVQERNAPEMKQTLEEIFKSPGNYANKEKESNIPKSFPENHLKVAHDTNQCNSSNVSTVNPEKNSKTVVVLDAQPRECNQTVLLCEDMELTEVIRPVHQIIVVNDQPFVAKSLDNANLGCEPTKENDVPVVREEMRDRNMNEEIISERDTQELFPVQPHSPKQLNDVDMQLPRLSENDEVLNVGMITFCETNNENVASRATKSSILGSRRTKPVKYAVFFSSDESDDNSSFEISSTKPKTSNRKTVIPAKSSKPSEKTEDIISQNVVGKSDLLKCSIDVLHLQKSEKKLEKKSTKQSKDVKISKSKDDLSKHVSQKCSMASKDANFKNNKAENIKKFESSHENDFPKHSSDKLTSKDENSKVKKDVNVKKVETNHENHFPKHSSDKSSTASKHKNIKLNKNVKKLGLDQENELPKNSSHKSSAKSKDKNIKLHENLKLIFSPISSPGILKKTKSNFQTTKEIGSETPLNRKIHSDNLDETITNVIESPQSESRKVSFAPTDLVCKFRKMSESKKIAENKKVRRTSKSVLDFEELLKPEAQSNASRAGADNFSESTNKQQKKDNQSTLNFSDNTELYAFHFPSNSNFSIAPTADDLMPKFSLNASRKTIKKSSKTSKKDHLSPKPLKNTGKLSLKKRKDHLKNTELNFISDQVFKERDVLLFESPLSVSKPAKRKSLFKEQLDDDAKENINHQIQDNILQETDKSIINVGVELTGQNNILKKSTSVKNQRKTQGKFSMKKLSDNHKKREPTSDIKKKKQSAAGKSLENSPVLKDTVNLPEEQGRMPSKRSSKPVCLKEPNNRKKLRRE